MPQQIKFDKYPEKTVQGYKAVQGWEDVRECLDKAAKENGVLTAEFYPGVYRGELVNELAKLGFAMFDAESCTISDEEYQELVAPFVTDDRVFGVMNTLRLEDIYREEKIEALRRQIQSCNGPAIVYGTGAALSLIHI